MGKSVEPQLLAKSVFASSLQNSVDYGRITMVIQEFCSPVTSVNLKKNYIFFIPVCSAKTHF